MFSSKRYVEEAERFSQPGSVAEKKAFFEAHYQRMDGKKHKADLINQLNVVDENPENPDSKDKETVPNKNNESKSNASMETKKMECVGESCALDLTKIGSKEEKKHGKMKSAPYSGVKFWFSAFLFIETWNARKGGFFFLFRLNVNKKNAFLENPGTDFLCSSILGENFEHSLIIET